MNDQLSKSTHTPYADDEKRERPRRSFHAFSLETARLESAFNGLKEQFQFLNLELQETNEKLHQKIAELNTITNYLKCVLDNMVQGILFVDINGIVTTCNRSAENILRTDSQALLFHSFWDHFDDRVFGFSIRHALEHQQNEMVDCITYTSPNNLQTELEVTANFVEKTTTADNDSIHSQGILIMLRDISEMRYLQIRANRADRMKLLGEMAAQVSHEIRNPLGGIKGFASLLKRDLVQFPEQQKLANYIVEGANTLNRIVGRILHYTRPIQTHLENIDLLLLLTELKQHILADTNINQQNLSVSIECFHKTLFLLLDASLLKSAILNLMVNSIQAMPHGGKLTLTVYCQPSHTILTITDTGTGISQENLSKLYSPFFTTKPDGNGLGLAEAQKVIQAHGGTIDVTSTIGKGTTFTIKFYQKGRYDY